MTQASAHSGGSSREIRHVHPDEESSPGLLLYGGGVMAAWIMWVLLIPVGIWIAPNAVQWAFDTALIITFAVPLVGASLAWAIDKFTRFRDRVSASIIFGVCGAVLGGLWGMVLADYLLRGVGSSINTQTSTFVVVFALVLAGVLGLGMGLGRYFADWIAQQPVVAIAATAILGIISVISAFRTLFSPIQGS